MPEGRDERAEVLRKNLRQAETWMRDYMKSFYNEDEDIQKAIRMKEDHTARVRQIARELAEHLGLSTEDILLAELMGLLHDVGRFRQFTVYRTFVDALSEDHASLGLRVIEDEKLIDTLSPEDRECVRFAIAVHNKKEIAPTEDARCLGFAKLLRDADKLDIYYVLLPFLAPPDGEGVSPDFVGKFLAAEQVDYTQIRTGDDRKLVRLMWAYDVNFAWTLRHIVERDYLEKIVRCLPTDAGLEPGVDRLRAYVERKCREHDDIGF